MVSTLLFFVNGYKVEDSNVDPEYTLLRYLREKLYLTGPKLACGEGGCGACTVMVSKINDGDITHYTVNACLCLVVSVHGLAVTTVEGIGNVKKLHPVQERIAKAHGTQCGFCTPGFVMSMYTLLRINPSPNMEEIEENLVGNLCRCTGYRPIIEGFKTFASKELSNECGLENCCRRKDKSENVMNNCFIDCNSKASEKDETFNISTLNGKTQNYNMIDGAQISENESCAEIKLRECDPKSDVEKLLFNPENCQIYDPSQDIIFPPELKTTYKGLNQNLSFHGPNLSYFRPTSVEEMLHLKERFPKAKLSAGNTEIGIEMRNENYPVIIHTQAVKELSDILITNQFLEVGASVTLTNFEKKINSIKKSMPEEKLRVLTEFSKILKLFGGTQIRNVATLGGNLITSSPISDLAPIFVASHSQAVFISKGKTRTIPIDDQFFTGYRQNVLKAIEVLLKVKIPFYEKNKYIYAFKQSRRRDDDIAIVNSGMSVEFENTVVKNVTLAFGGMGPTTVLAPVTSEYLKGKTWSNNIIKDVCSRLIEELKLHPSAPGGMTEYRTTLAASLFNKFFFLVASNLNLDCVNYGNNVTEDEKLLLEDEKYTLPSASQLFQEIHKAQKKIDAVGRPEIHLSAFKHTTGEAIYLDDIPSYPLELHGAFVISKKAAAQIISIDALEATKMDGVVAFLSAKDLTKEENTVYVVIDEEEIFASNEVRNVGQSIGLILAKDHLTARKAALLVKVEYRQISKPIISLEDAVKRNSFMHNPAKIEIGNIEKGFKESDYVIQGGISIGGQEHFYMEPNCTLAIPGEDGEMEVYASSQNLTGLQRNIAKILKVPMSKITCRTKRIGGAFGGKDFRTFPIHVPAAIAAHKFQRPIRIVLDRDDDFAITGGRNPFKAEWKAGIMKFGQINSVDVSYYLNAGSTSDCSPVVLERSIACFLNAYSIPNARYFGRCCKTNIRSNTAFRGFGSPQTTLIAEDIMLNVSSYLNMPPHEIRSKNLASFGSIICINMKDDTYSMERCWNEVLKSSDYSRRYESVEVFNSKYTYKKRGIEAVPIKYPCGFGLTSISQGSCMVNIYLDGSVLVTHGGSEMGQGLHTKVLQTVSRALEISLDKVQITETTTNVIPNATQTAASISSDIYCMAAVDACNVLKERLAPYRIHSSWEESVSKAYFDRVSLSSTGFHKIPGLKDWDFETGEGSPYAYFSYGAAVTEVEIDCLTGDHKVLRTDIVMDVGNSLNPAIDIGQIEGAFIQGMGLYTLEELLYSPDGTLLQKGPGTYKIPSIKDIPKIFNVSFLRDSPNPSAVYSSRAVGEPPILLSSSVFCAIREAVRSTRPPGMFSFNSPSTAEKIRMACKDWIVNQVPKDEKGNFVAWSVEAET